MPDLVPKPAPALCCLLRLQALRELVLQRRILQLANDLHRVFDHLRPVTYRAQVAIHAVDEAHAAVAELTANGEGTDRGAAVERSPFYGVECFSFNRVAFRR